MKPAAAFAFSVALLAVACGPRASNRTAASDPLVEDPPFFDAASRADLVPVVIDDGGPALLGLAFLAPGSGPHPTVMLLHGFPGYETNHDLARAAQRAGWNALFFRYRGSWGSRGSYSFAGALEDVSRALHFLRDPATGGRLRTDPDRIAIAGHSFGGFLALKVAAGDPRILGSASIAGFDMGAHTAAMREDADLLERTVAAFEESLAPLRGATASGLVAEMLENETDWTLAATVPRLADRPVLLVAGHWDDVAPLETHHRPLAWRFRAADARVTEAVLLADHDFSSARVALARTLLAWLADLEPPIAGQAR